MKKMKKKKNLKQAIGSSSIRLLLKEGQGSLVTKRA